MENSEKYVNGTAQAPDAALRDTRGVHVLPHSRGLQLLAAIGEWRTRTMPLAKDMGSTRDELLHAVLGVAGEAGELADAIKKHWAYEKPLDVTNIREEAGDLLFYLMLLLDECGISLESVFEQNTAKLARRYPSGYSNAAAQARADKQEDAESPAAN